MSQASPTPSMTVGKLLYREMGIITVPFLPCTVTVRLNEIGYIEVLWDHQRAG